jgi:hypothetical protein
MKLNLGTTDRFIRVFLGIVILMFLPVTKWALLGLLPLVTGIVGWCALYQLFGWSTNRPRKTA